MAGSSWQRKVQREYREVDGQFMTQELPIGAVDGSSFGLIADATEYMLVREADGVHLRARTAVLDSVLASLAQGGRRIPKADALRSVRRFADLWEAKLRERGKWDGLIRSAEQDGEIESPAKEHASAGEGPVAKLRRKLFGN